MLNADTLRATAIKLSTGQHRVHCPQCHNTRKNKTDRSLSIEVDADAFKWNCWHCFDTGRGWLFSKTPTYQTRTVNHIQRSQVMVTPSLPETLELSVPSLAFLEGRGISQKTAEIYGVRSTSHYYRDLNREADTLVFTSRDAKGDAVSHKYRSTEGKYFAATGRQVAFWGLATASPTGSGQTLVVTEGELDALSCHEAGFHYSISVPSGASTIREGGPDKLSYISSGQQAFDTAEKIIIFTDNDTPGQALGEELARRIGKHRCWYITLPIDCKDANDVLVKHGSEALQNCLVDARPWPVSGLYNAIHYTDKVLDLYHNGQGKGLSTGLLTVDSIYTVVPGQVTVVTGIPSSGKSEWVDQVMVNLAVREDWNFCLASFENPPALHIVKLMEKYTGIPFFPGTLPRVQEDDVNKGMSWVNTHFSFIESADGLATTIDTILDRARISILRHGCRGVLIDPYNFIERGNSDQTETEQVSDMLSKVRRFAIAHDVHIWFVAHPQKMYRTDGGDTPIPTGYDILGSSHWYNKADMGVTIHRPKGMDTTMVRVWKCRFKWVGKNGDVFLRYDLPTGRYSDADLRPDFEGFEEKKDTDIADRYWNE